MDDCEIVCWVQVVPPGTHNMRCVAAQRMVGYAKNASHPAFRHSQARSRDKFVSNFMSCLSRQCRGKASYPTTGVGSRGKVRPGNWSRGLARAMLPSSLPESIHGVPATGMRFCRIHASRSTAPEQGTSPALRPQDARCELTAACALTSSVVPPNHGRRFYPPAGGAPRRRTPARTARRAGWRRPCRP